MTTYFLDMIDMFDTYSSSIIIGVFPYLSYNEYLVIESDCIEIVDFEEYSDDLKDSQRLIMFESAESFIYEKDAIRYAFTLSDKLTRKNQSKYEIYMIHFERPLPIKTPSEAKTEIEDWWKTNYFEQNHEI